jgi:hypothetical protein
LARSELLEPSHRHVSNSAFRKEQLEKRKDLALKLIEELVRTLNHLPVLFLRKSYNDGFVVDVELSLTVVLSHLGESWSRGDSPLLEVEPGGLGKRFGHDLLEGRSSSQLRKL